MTTAGSGNVFGGGCWLSAGVIDGVDGDDECDAVALEVKLFVAGAAAEGRLLLLLLLGCAVDVPSCGVWVRGFPVCGGPGRMVSVCGCCVVVNSPEPSPPGLTVEGDGLVRLPVFPSVDVESDGCAPITTLGLVRWGVWALRTGAFGGKTEWR